MQHFAPLLDALAFQPGRNAKLALLRRYLATTPDPDRGWALAALTGALSLTNAKPALLRELGVEAIGEPLFTLSYDYVGDLAETVSLIWPAKPEAEHPPPPRLSDVIATLEATSRRDLPALLVRWLDSLDGTGRWALLKLITGGLRVGVSARMAKMAVAALGNLPLDEIEEVWHGLEPPYVELFAWAEGRAPRPDPGSAPTFRPFMLATPLNEAELAAMDPADYRAEWKWDGIRVQLVAIHGERRLYSRGGEEIGAAFPDIVDAMTFDAVLDGELVIAHRDGDEVRIAPFNDLQQRLNRKTATAKQLMERPAHVRLYDALMLDGEDLRGLPLDTRRTRLEAWFAEQPRRRLDLSPLLPFTRWEELAALRADARAASIEGLMLKRRDAPYVAGRPKGPWFKWKRDTLHVDAVVMYAQRGHGKRSSYYSDFTFGCWRPALDGSGGRELVPIGKAYSGFTDAELLKLDRWVRKHTVNRFGPVLEVAPGLVVEVEFDAVQRSARHKSGVALRFPRFHRIRWDKPAEEADLLSTVVALIA